MSDRKTFVAERRARRRCLKTAIVGEVRKGLHGSEAARQQGVCVGTFWQWQFSDSKFQDRLASARAAGVRHIKRTVLDQLRAGKLLKEAAAVAGRTASSIHNWRKKDAAFGAAVVALRKKRRKLRTSNRGLRKKKSGKRGGLRGR